MVVSLYRILDVATDAVNADDVLQNSNIYMHKPRVANFILGTSLNILDHSVPSSIHCTILHVVSNLNNPSRVG